MHRAIVYNGWIDNLVFVNMNARLYDPQNGRFLAPDPIIQTPDNPQNFNRYTYCLNNPLRYIDSTGMFATEEEARNYGNKYGGAEVGYSHLRGEWYVLLNGRGTWKYTGGTTVTKAYSPQYYEGSFFMGGSPGSTPNYENLPDAVNTIAGGLGASNGVTTTVINKVAKKIPEYSGYRNGLKRVGRFCATINIGIAFYNYMAESNDGTLTTGKKIKYVADIIVGTVSIFVPGGAVIGTAYFLGDILTNGYGTNDE